MMYLPGPNARKQPSPRRVKILEVSPEILLDLLANREPITISFEGLPADVALVHSRVGENGRIELLVSSESFPKVLPGHQLERFTVTVERYHLPLLTEMLTT